MKREPSIHITEGSLVKILDELSISHRRYTKKGLAKLILTTGRKHCLTNRLVSISNEKMKRDVSKLIKSSRGDAALFSTILVAVRRQHKHRGLKPIKAGSDEWKQMKSITSLVIEFCKEFDLEKREGFRIYIDLAMSRTKKFALNKLSSLYSAVAEDYQALKVIESDPRPSKTKEAHDIYNQIIINKTGIPHDYSKEPGNYQYFVFVSEVAKKLGIGVKLYIEAQFAALEWTKGVPQPIQLTGDKAQDRLRKYLYEKDIKIEAKSQRRKSFSDILDKNDSFDK